MKLEKKKALIARTLNIGKGRIVLNTSRLAELKEAITKQDIKDLFKDGVISINEIKGRKKVIRRKTRRRAGSIRKKVTKRKKDYVRITRKLRAYLKNLKNKSLISSDKFKLLRKQIRSKEFKSLSNFKERIKEVLEEDKKWE